MKQHPPLFAYPTYFLNGLQGPHLVVGVHDGDQYGPFGDVALYIGRVYHAKFVYRNIADLIAQVLKVCAGLEDGRVLDLTRYYVITLLFIGMGNTFEDHVV